MARERSSSNQFFMYDNLKSRLRQYEGVVPHLYLDSLGNVTVAVGHLLPTYLTGEDMILVLDGRFVTSERRRKEWELVKALEPNHLPEYYAERTTLRMPQFAIDDLLDADVAAKAKELATAFPNWQTFPEAAQEALLDMAFNLGTEGLRLKFPRLCAAAEEGKWGVAAEESHRQGIAEERNQATAELFRMAGAAQTSST